MKLRAPLTPSRLHQTDQLSAGMQLLACPQAVQGAPPKSQLGCAWLMWHDCNRAYRGSRDCTSTGIHTQSICNRHFVTCIHIHTCCPILGGCVLVPLESVGLVAAIPASDTRNRGRETRCHGLRLQHYRLRDQEKGSIIVPQRQFHSQSCMWNECAGLLPTLAVSGKILADQVEHDRQRQANAHRNTVAVLHTRRDC